ncbi:MAG: hypothetical protein M3N46_06815, partial [Actinomycetota bacterium]|nr:hypothetical protein [Actinomycetota bacterium]
VIRTTLTSCRTDDEWVAALKMHPGAGSLTTYTTKDADQFLAIVCLGSKADLSTPICTEASKNGLLSH